MAAYMEHRAELRAFLAVRVRSGPEADDLVQELYLKVAAVEDSADIQQPLAYLYRLASNLMLDRLRSAKRTARRDDDWRKVHHIVGPEDVADLPSPTDAMAARQRLAKLIEALAELPEPVQRSFKMHKFEGMGHKEVAERLGISRSLVEKHMIAALRHLADRVRDAD
jgi:RNA polymerase sigma-70 factor (ECF subfamily)